MASDWTSTEVQTIVAAYMAMLRLELANKAYNKAAYRRQVLPLLNSRSEGSIEFKHQNVSAVLHRNGWPYIYGYKPRFNYQTLLAEAVVE